MFLLFPLFIDSLGGDEIRIGLVLGTGIAASVALRPTVGALLDRLGRRQVLLWSGAVNATTLPLFLLVGSVGRALFLLSAVHFIVGGALFAAYFTYAADLVPPERRIEGIAIFGVAGMATNGLGPTLGEMLIARGGYPAFFLVAAGFASVSFGLTALIPRTPTRTRERYVDPLGASASVWRDMLRTALHAGVRRILIATVLFGAGMGAAFSCNPHFAQELGVALASPSFAPYASTPLVLRFFGRRLPDRLGPGRITVPAFGVFALGLAAICLLPLRGVLVLAGIACGAGH